MRVRRKIQAGRFDAFWDDKPGASPVQRLALLAYKKRAAGGLLLRALNHSHLDKPKFLGVQGMCRGESSFKPRHVQAPALAQV